MTIAPQLRQYLDDANADYDIVEHRPTMSALETARSCDIPAQRLAKAVLLDTADDDHLLAVLPSDRRVELAELRTELGQKPRLANEAEVGKMFKDCELGSVPAVGYGISTIIDDALSDQPEVYFEAGDHKSLVHMNRNEFSRLTGHARHGQFSEPWLSE
jgi:Ala-tRNA(Pro) deacylase